MATPAAQVVSTLSVPLLFLGGYLRRKRAAIAHLPPSATAAAPDQPKQVRPSHQSKKPAHLRPHHHAADKDAAKKHHHLDVNTLRGHTDLVTALHFSNDGCNLATACADGAVRVFRIDDVWEIVYSKDSSVKEINKAMQLKGHKSAATCLCFTPNSEQIITASKDGSIRVLNINVMYIDVRARRFGQVYGRRSRAGQPSARMEEAALPVSP